MLSEKTDLTSIYSVDSLVYSIDKYHPPIELLIKFEKFKLSDHYEWPCIYNIKKCNFDEISHFLSNIDFNLNLNNDLSLDSTIDIFYEKKFIIYIHLVCLFLKLKSIIITLLFGKI